MFVCVRDGMDVLCLYCEACCCRYSCKCFVMQMLYVCVLCILWQFSILRPHDLQFLNAGQGWKRHTPEQVSRLPCR